MDNEGMLNSDFFSLRGPKADKTRRWYEWHEPGTSSAEKKLLLKMDFFILLYTCLTFFVKYLDQTNVTNAWLSGHGDMQKALKAGPDDLNWYTTYFNIGIIIGAPISTCLITVIHPRYWLPACTFAWSFCVLFMYKAQNSQTIFGLRFVCGLFEAGAYPGSFYIIGSWYKRSEISKRTGLFLFSSTVGAMTSGFIQSGLLKNMDGHLGIAAWRWLFILDFCLGIPVAIFGFFVCPNEPESKRMWWMTKDEQMIAIKRMRDDGREANGKWDLATIKKILVSWQLYTFVVAWAFIELTCGVNLMRWLGLYLQKVGYNKYDVQNLPAIGGFPQLAWIFLSSTVADLLDNRALPFFLMAFVQLLCYVVFYVNTSDHSLRLAAYYLATSYNSLSPLLASWINCSCSGNRQMRAFISAMMVSVGYAVESPAQQVLFPVSDSPYFQKTHGYAFGIGMIVATMVWGSIVIPVINRYFGPKEACCSVICEPMCCGPSPCGPSNQQTESDREEVIHEYGTIKGDNKV
ncbi:hypothetical protein VHEMI04319 [[Torrubiella] hemipterigena]|uniref:Major facilitator superfamily (MFS) profile domain-containing protein n=1 Tax=[Torrubiella] hemipterigena TaxID=1531966 RepID=A0A0A1TDX3_9HYPO|nr:hypothetical protein VHEMI04319 [[Torrubiella] hemipterigena]